MPMFRLLGLLLLLLGAPTLASAQMARDAGTACVIGGVRSPR